MVEIDFFERAAGDRGKITNLPQTLGNNNCSPRSPSHCERSKNSFCSNAASSSKTSYYNDFRVGKNSRHGSAKSPTKGGNFPTLSDDGFYSHLFLIPKKDGTMRPVLDLSLLNNFIENKHFQLENLSSIKTLLNPGD